jgi:hypothetical protein
MGDNNGIHAIAWAVRYTKTRNMGLWVSNPKS